MTQEETTSTISIKGVYYAVSAFTLWGMLPIYWKLLDPFASGEILANRIFWSAVFVILLLAKRQQLHEIQQIVRQPAKLALVTLSAMIISGNWFVYIWAVGANRVVEASMGYYINPLIVILMGMLILKEKVNRLEGLAIFLATVGVLIITFQYGEIPWVSLALATTFASYGLLKKMVQVESLAALGIETLLMAPAAMMYLLYRQPELFGTIVEVRWWHTALLPFSGVFTALPLLWFARAARLVPLSVIGFSQYLAPTLMLLLGVFLFREPFSATQAVSFGFIWAGLILFSVAQTKKAARTREANRKLSQTVKP